ncbi:hypothetical protein [Lysobacter sp. Hz 25]|uniref:hypothetical protein n=1 Tax=Lysobacter sp. Hz 25 TaxID=3383698 RepID=UPI0038D4A00B
MPSRWTSKLALAAALAAAVLATPVYAAPASANAEMTPERVAELYLRLALRNDVEAGKRLNDYLQPAFDGKEALNIEYLATVPGLMQPMYEEYADTLLKSLPKVDPARAKPAIVAAMLAQHAAVAGAECRALSREETANDAVENQRIAKVAYRCKVPVLDQSIEQLLASENDDPKAVTTDFLVDGFDRYRRSFETAAGTREIDGVLNLYGGNGQPWLTGSYADVIDVVTDGMLKKSAE